MSTPINELLAPTARTGNSNPSRFEIVPSHERDVLNLRRLPARLNVAQTAALLNCGDHDIPILVSRGLLKPLGHPQPNAVKYFAPTDVLELAGDSERMGRICDTIHEYWRGKNAAKSSGAHRRRSPANGKVLDKRDRSGVAAHNSA